MNREEIRTRILDALNESTTAPAFWSAAQIHAVIQEGLEVLSEEAELVLRTALTALRPGTTYYATRGIAPDMLAPYRIWLPSQNRRLVAVTMGQLDAYHERWPTVTGPPQYWFPMGWDWFGIWPSVSTGGGILRVDYLAWPREMDTDTDRPELYEADQDGLILYGLYEGLLKRWDAATAAATFTKFLSVYGLTKGRSGVNRLQARTWAQDPAPAHGFRSGMGSFSPQ